MFTVPAANGQQVPLSQVTNPYRVRLVLIQAELELLDGTGKITGRVSTSIEPVFEAEFFPELLEFLKRQGVVLDDPAPTTIEPV